MEDNMYNLLIKYFAGEVSAQEKRTLFQQLSEDEQLRKEALGMQTLSTLVSIGK